MTELVTTEIVDGVADVRLNRADKYNALSGDMFKAIIAAGEALADRSDVRAVVLSGNGPGFCAGLDFASFQGMSDSNESGSESDAESQNDSSGSAGGLLARDDRPENFAQRPAYVWRKLPVPVIAAVHGVAYGGGCQVALGADIRIARPDAKMSIMEIKWGLVPDMSLTQTLRDIVPLDVAKELTFTGRVLTGVEAKELGLVTRLDDNPLEAALALAREIASKSPDAIRAGKLLLDSAWHADERTGLELESSLQTALIGKPNQVESIKANFEKRAPKFSDPS